MNTKLKVRYPYMQDRVVKQIFSINKKEERMFTSTLIADALGIDKKIIYNNIVLLPKEIVANKNLVQSEVDLLYYLSNNSIIINIEFSTSDSKRIRAKNNNYVYLLATKDIKSAKDYDNIPTVVQINLDTFDYLNLDEYKYEGTLMDTKHHKEFDTSVRIIHYNIEYFKNMMYNDSDSELIKILKLLASNEESNIPKSFYKGSEFMEKVKQDADELRKTAEEKLYYDKEELDKEVAVEQRAYQIARNMLKDNVPLETIMKYTNLSIEELNWLKERM